MSSSSRAYNYSVLLTFALTGVGIALLGSALPAMLAEWHLSDLRGGTLLLCAWGGATVNPLFSRGHLRRTIVLGALLTAMSMFLLAALPASFAYCILVLYGLGLGITITSISVLRVKETAPERRKQELNRLNMLWALGAAAGPWLTTHTLQSLRVSSLFFTAGGLFSIAALLLFLTSLTSTTPIVHAVRLRDTLAWIPPVFAAMAATVVAVESSIGGWLTTYAQRSEHMAPLSISATSVFWIGLLISRGVASTSWLEAIPIRRLMMAGATLACAALLLLIYAPAHAAPAHALLPASLLAGLGIGPLYPYALSLVLVRFPGNTVFFFAGLGSSLGPWLTGFLSTTTHSLRLGLLAPTAGTLMLLLLLALSATATETPTEPGL